MFPPAKFKESLYLALDDPEGIADSHEVESVDKEKEPDAAPNSEASRIPLTKTSPGLFGRPEYLGRLVKCFGIQPKRLRVALFNDRQIS